MRRWTVVKVQHLGTYTCRACATYRLYMADGAEDAWTKFLRDIVGRPGWSVARLARESGIDRSHIHRMMRGEGKTVTVESVRMIAKGAGVSLASALHAARARTMTEPVDTADEDDPEVRAIRESGLSDRKKRDLLAHLARRRQQLAEEVDMLIKASEEEPEPEHTN